MTPSIQICSNKTHANISKKYNLVTNFGNAFDQIWRDSGGFYLNDFWKYELSVSSSFLPFLTYCFLSTINATYTGWCELFSWLFATISLKLFPWLFPLKPSLCNLLKTGCRQPGCSTAAITVLPFPDVYGLNHFLLVYFLSSKHSIWGSVWKGPKFFSSLWLSVSPRRRADTGLVNCGIYFKWNDKDVCSN